MELIFELVASLKPSIQFGLLGLFLLVVVGGGLYVINKTPDYDNTLKDRENKQFIIEGEHLKKDCKLIETNIYHGFFSRNTNRLDCGGVIENVNTDEYKETVNYYMDSLSSSKKN
jgi:hypothetical protein